jgi:hypothetical protein
MRIDRRVSPNQAALWTLYELHNGAGQRPAVVRLACYYGRSTEVNGGHPGHSSAQVRTLDHDRSPFFQAGRAGSIPSPAPTLNCQVTACARCIWTFLSHGSARCSCPIRAQRSRPAGLYRQPGSRAGCSVKHRTGWTELSQRHEAIDTTLWTPIMRVSSYKGSVDVER